MAKFADKMEKLADGVTGGYQKIEDGVVGGYKKIENGVVGGFNKISDRFVDTFLAKEGKTVADAKARLAQEQTDRETAAKEAARKCEAEQKTQIEAGIQSGRDAGKRN